MIIVVLVVVIVIIIIITVVVVIIIAIIVVLYRIILIMLHSNYRILFILWYLKTQNNLPLWLFVGGLITFNNININ